MTQQLKPSSAPIRQKTCAFHRSSDYAVNQHTAGRSDQTLDGESMGLQLKTQFCQPVIGDPPR
jgi:hypothetical protein